MISIEIKRASAKISGLARAVCLALIELRERDQLPPVDRVKNREKSMEPNNNASDWEAIILEIERQLAAVEFAAARLRALVRPFIRWASSEPRVGTLGGLKELSGWLRYLDQSLRGLAFVVESAPKFGGQEPKDEPANRSGRVGD